MNKRLKRISFFLVMIILLQPWHTSISSYVSANDSQSVNNEIIEVRIYDIQGSEFTSSNRAAADDRFIIELDWQIAEEYDGISSLTFTLPDCISAGIDSGPLEGGAGTYSVENNNVSFEFGSGNLGQTGTVNITAAFSKNVLFLLNSDDLTITFGDSEGTTLTIPFDAAATVNFNTQPTSVGDVQAVIDEYYNAVDAAAIPRAHWQYQVSDELMPAGFTCEYVDDDIDFGAPYYSFAAVLSPRSNGEWGGNGLEATPYEIEDAADLEELAKRVNEGTSYAGCYFKLTDDIDLSNCNWIGIGGYGTKPFAGNFNGNDLAIYGLQGSMAKSGYGLFGYLTGEVKNLTVNLGAAGLINSASYTGVIAGWTDGATITNCNVDGLSYSVNSSTEAGGIVGHAAKNVKIINCNVKNISITAKYEVAGIAGRMGTASSGSGNNAVTGCTVENITATVTGGGYAAGLIGIVAGDVNYSNSSYISDCTVTNVSATTSGNYAAGLIGTLNMENGYGTTHNYVENCHVNEVTISADIYAGGLFGCMRYGDVKSCSVTSGNVTARSNYAGGASGVIYDGSMVDSCAVNDLIIEAVRFAGGFAADIYADYTGYPSTVKKSFTSGGTVTSTSRYPAGGFTARLRSTSQISYCYAQSDVFNTSTTASTVSYSGNGGFVGTMYDKSKITDCYATGSVTAKGNQYSGAFAGQNHVSTSTISNCFGTGTVSGGSSTAGFAGYNSGASSIINSFYDTTMTRKTTAVSNGQKSGIVALSTTDAIDYSTFDTGGTLESWGIYENTRGAAEESGNEASPWYIDDDITYPYLFYQYNDRAEEDVNYNMSALTYADNTFVAQKRSDFTILKDSLDLKAKSAGAQKAYFPYSGTSLHSINTTTYESIEGASYDQEANALWSLGSVSRTGIISFANTPRAVKSSSRPEWNVSDENTYTYVGDTVTYKIKINNFSTEADFVDLVFQDYLPSGVTFIDDSINLTTGNDEVTNGTIVPKGESNNKPSYSYDSNLNVLTIYLADLPKVSEANGISYHIITFDAYVTKEAASIFTGQEIYEGNIRNTGFVTGKLRYSDTDVSGEIKVTFDDENEDPVYGKNSGSITIEKYGDDNTPLEGACFALARWDENSSNWIDIAYDTDNGTWHDNTGGSVYFQKTALDNGSKKAVTVFYNLPLNRYKIYEVLAPEGYSQLLEEFEATIPTSDEAGNSVYDITYQVYNNRVLELPKTGRGLSGEQVIIIGFTITVIGGVLFLYKRRFRKREEI